ncbi:MAG: MaoC family dehydratase N-terminal domain-containing protein [Betaproteobacteria bacterium]|nr:MaoC family dehydratase N-terminal domain-containing protein [Betaproteobacteria bacterium]
MTHADFGFHRVLSQVDFDRFARLSGDDNPIHCDPSFARNSHFGATVSHGMFLYSLIYKALAETMSDPGALQVEQELMFPNPGFAGDDIDVRVTHLETGQDGSLCFATSAGKQVNGERIITAEGRARVIPSCSRAAFAAYASSQTATDVASAHGDATLYGLQPGMRALTERTFTAADLAEYADLTGDCNPLHFDPDWAKRHGFTGCLVPAPLLSSMFSALLGTRLPGRGTGWMKQKLRFVSPAYLDEQITAQVEIIRLRGAKELVNLATTLTGADGRVVCIGEALVLVRNLELLREGRIFSLNQ